MIALILGISLVSGLGQAQALPATAGETLTGRRILLSETVRGHAAVIVVGFSKDASDGCGAWARALRADPSFAGVATYQVAMLEQAPGFMRGVIKAGMRKGVAPAEQDSFVVLVQDDKQWRSYFGVTNDKEPYVLLLDASGQVRWHGHGEARDLEPLLRSAKP
jgi:hypothetical protein